MDSGKRILILHSSSDLYGASKVALETLKIFIDNGNQVFFGLSSEGALCKEVEDLGGRIVILPLATIRRKYLTIGGLINRFFTYKKSIRALRQFVKENQIDLIYTSTTGVITGAIISKRIGLKHCWHVLEITPGPKWLLKLYGHLLSKYAHVVLAVSDAVKNHWYNVNPNMNIKKLYNGFYLEEFQGDERSLRAELEIDDQTVLIGIIARVHFWKGQTYFLEMAAELISKNSNLRFIMVGDAYPGYEYLYEEINQKILDVGLSEYVINLGYRTDVNKILKALDIFILPSIQPDPLPTTVLEAMASEKPVIATNHGGAPEMLVDGETGFLIPWNNPKEASGKVQKLIDSKELRLEMGRAGKVRVQTIFSREQHEKKLLEIMSSI